MAVALGVDVNVPVDRFGIEEPLKIEYPNDFEFNRLITYNPT